MRHLITSTLVVLTVSSAGVGLGAQEVVCDLRVEDLEVVGECRGDSGLSFTLHIQQEEGAAVWAGAAQLAQGSSGFQVAPYPYEAGSEYVVKTPFGWFFPETLALDEDPPRLAWSMEREVPPSRVDLDVLDRAREILGDEVVWDRADDRVCAPGDTVFSLYCAMAEAVRQVTGEYQHRQPALQIVRRVVARSWSGRVTNHRLMDFNNHTDTTFEDIANVFAEAREDLLAAMR